MSHHSFTQVSGERAEAWTPSFFHGNTRANLEETSSLLSTPTAMTSPDQVSCGDGLHPVESGEHTVKGPTALPENERSCAPVVTGSSPAGIHFVKKFSYSSGLKSRNSQNSLKFFSNSGVCWRSAFLGRIATYLAELMRRTLAPLRKIVSRELEVFEFGRNSVHPQSFAVHDRMECGHVHTSLLWDIFDLINPYTESPHVRAKRHRCQECLTLVQRKPIVSVAAVAKAA